MTSSETNKIIAEYMGEENVCVINYNKTHQRYNCSKHGDIGRLVPVFHSEFNPCESIADAWKVVEFMKDKYDFKIVLNRFNGLWACEFFKKNDTKQYSAWSKSMETAPMAICLTAIKVMEGEG